MTKEEIAAKLKAARSKTGMTQAQVAQATGKSPKLVGHWETGYSQPDADTLSILFKLYNLEANAFFDYDTTKAPAEQELKDEREIDAELAARLWALTPEEWAKVDAFVQGLLASR